MNHIRRSGGLFGVLAVFSVALALFTSTGAYAWSDSNANTIASMMTDGGKCSSIIQDKNKVVVALKAIPDPTTATNIGGLKGDWPSGALVTAIMSDGYNNLIMGNNAGNCFDIDKIVTYGMNKANNNTTPAPTQNAIQKAIMDQVNAKISTWADDLCKTSLDTQCRTVQEANIKKLAISCYTATSTTTSTKIATYQDLQKCAGVNVVNAATAQQDCEATGKVWNTTTKACEEKKAGTSNCIIDGVGWIICPVANAMASMTDRVFDLLKMMLQTPPLSVVPNANTNPLYGAWSSMRNIANIVFVIAFMIIIYSQITSAGISNYGIKKMLPKLLISAILINVSFWICVLAVDLSNVLGSSLYNVLSGFTSGSSGGDSSVSWVSVITVLLGGAAAGALTYGGVTIAATALGGGSALGLALLWLALPMLLAVAIAIIIGATVLALRQALIIMLVFISPLAFAAYLLPNTQVWFDKWRKLFTTMLVFYPLFALLFGGANIASWVLLSSAASATTSLKGVLILTGMLVLFLPLFLVPMLIKTSSGLLGKFATKMQGGVSRAANPLNKMARGRTAMNMGLAKGRLLTGSTTATNRFGRRTFGSRVNGLAQSIDSSGRTRKMMQEDLDTTRDANWQEQVARDKDLAALDTSTRTQKLRKEGSEAYREADWKGQVAQDTSIAALDTNLRTQKLRQDGNEAEREADWKEDMVLDPQLQQQEFDVRATRERGKSADRVQNEKYAKRLATPGGSVELQTAAGIDTHGEKRVLAAATQAEFAAFDEHVKAEKALLSADGINATAGKDIVTLGPKSGSLDEMIRNPSLSTEQRAAAASRILQTGSDSNIHEMLNYLGTTTDKEAASIQKQVAADLGSRKPKSLGQFDVSSLTTGTYGVIGGQDPVKSQFNYKVLERVQNGKQSGESLASAGVDELDRIIAVLGSNPKPVAGTDEAKNRAALMTSIDQYYASAATSGRQVPNDIKVRMDSVKGTL